MMARTLPPIAFLRECFSYNPDTGEFRWRTRPAYHFTDAHVAAKWNARFPGTPAFVHQRPHGYLWASVTYAGVRHALSAARVGFILMTGEVPPTVDHINHCVTDNRFSNLRAATCYENARNRLGFSRRGLPKGVYAKRNAFVALIMADGKREFLGSFGTPESAHAAYCVAARKLHGAFCETEHATPAQNPTDIFS